MAKHVFSGETQQMLLAPQAWRIVSSLFAPEVAPVSLPRRRAWMRQHEDRHLAREVLVSLGGHGHYGFGNRIFPCPPGTVFFFDTYEPHDSLYPPDAPDLRHLWLFLFGDEVFARLREVREGRLSERFTPALTLTGTAAGALLTTTWSELAAAPRLPAPVARARLVAALAAVLSQIAAADCTDAPPAQDGAAAETVIRAIQRHVAAHDGRHVPLAEAARLAGYSKYHFCRLFRTVTGQSYHACVDACRLRKARALLAAGERKKAIAEAIGFSHASPCLRWMKHHRLTPRDPRSRTAPPRAGSLPAAAPAEPRTRRGGVPSTRR